MLRKTWMIALAVGAGLVGSLILNALPSLQLTYARESAGNAQGERVLVHGHGVASSSKKPFGERFTLISSDAPNRSFKIVPPGKRFVLTDMMFHDKGSVRQNLTVNISNELPSIDKANILLQVPIKPQQAEEIHLCSGYVISSGQALAAWTNAGLEPEQYVQISVTGYLEDDK